MIVELTLPYPPTSNHNTMAVRGRRISSPKYRAWREKAETAIKAQTPPHVAGGYYITYTVDRPDRRRRDVENLPKSLSDALQAAGVIADDCHCLDARVLWSQREPGAGARVVVRIEAL